MKKIVLMIGILVVLLSVIFTACNDGVAEREKPEYTKEDITLKFKNESGVKCYVEISGESCTFTIGQTWISSFNFPTVLKTEIPVGQEKSITVKDVVVSGKSHLNTVTYQQRVNIKAFSDDSKYKDGYKYLDSELKGQYTGGAFHIKLKDNNTFDIDFIN